MKKKISRILGVVLTLVLLSSLAIVSTPVSAGTQSWTTYPTPLQGAAGNLVLDAGNTFTGPMVMDKDGTAIYAASNVGGGGAALVKSTDGGRTWAALTGFTATIAGVPGTFTDIVCSSIDANTVYVTDGTTIWKSINGGTTWAPLSSLFTSLGLTPGFAVGPPAGNGYIVSLDVGYLGASPYIFAGISGFGFSPAGGGAYVCEEAVWGMPWSNLLIDTDRAAPLAGLPDVTDIRVDPTNFATTQMVMAVVTDRGGAVPTLISTKYGGAQWDSIVNDVNLPGVASALYTASLWLPDDFSSSLTSGLMQAFVGVDPMTAAQGDVFLAFFAVPAVPATAAFDLNVSGIAVATHVSGLDGVGSAAGASLLAAGSTQTLLTVPRVFRSTPGGFTWLGDIKRPTGGATPFPITRALPSILVLDSTTALVSTHGADCGVSITNDYGAVWNTISLVNDAIGTIDDLEPGSFFMATWSGGIESVWRNDGNWERVFSTSLNIGATAFWYQVDVSPAGDAVFLAEILGTRIWRSLDSGQTWMLQVNNITSTGLGTGIIGDLAVIDANTLVVGDGNNINTVYTTTTNGGFWFTRVCNVGGPVTSMARDAGTGDLLAGGVTGAGAAMVARSQNQGISWAVIAAAVPLGVDVVDVAGDVATNVIVTFSNNYGGTIFATGTITTDGVGNDTANVYRYDYNATVPAWAQVDGGGAPADITNGTGLVAGPATTAVSGAEMVYASDAVAGEGVTRVRQPRTVAEQMADAASTFGSFAGLSNTNNLWAGSNTLYAIDTVGWRVRTYTDTLNVSGTGVAVSAITTTTATVGWTALANATNYLVVVNTTAQTNFYTAGNSGTALLGPWVNGNNANVPVVGTTAALTGLVPGVAYNVSVWANAPVSSYLFNAAAVPFTTLPAPPVAPANLVPANGAINIPILGPAFAWAPPAGVPGITGYNFELTTDPTFAAITVGKASPAVPYLVWGTALEYETAYYWRVQAVTATGVSTWVTSVFTTVAEAEPPVTVEPPPTPTITVIQPTPTVTVIPPDIDVTVIPPDITVDIPPATTTIVEPVIEWPDEVTPAYIWAIVAIGALLVIAVIILIIRTRRVV
ncbi:hypothetical protein ES707_03074 [subsurface metagenome]